MVTHTLKRDPLLPDEVEYPESDGQPMGETDAHVRAIINIRVMLENHFASQPDVYVSGNMFLYYEPGEPTQSVVPDVFVARGVSKRLRRVYKVWEEGKGPDFVLEVTSRSTRGEDVGKKKGLYEYLGVREYALFDPLGEYLRPPLQGYRLIEGRYEPIALNDQGGFASEVLGLELRVRDDDLRLYDPEREEWLLTPQEEADARREAEAEVVRLRQEIDRLRARTSEA